jgi:hypothetical protein
MTQALLRVAFERDEGQHYAVGARVSVHAMDDRYRTLTPNAENGDYRVTRCEWIRDKSWQALRVSLMLIESETRN